MFIIWHLRIFQILAGERKFFERALSNKMIEFEAFAMLSNIESVYTTVLLCIPDSRMDSREIQTGIFYKPEVIHHYSMIEYIERQSRFCTDSAQPSSPSNKACSLRLR